MEYISIAIVDDEKPIRDLYESYLKEWAVKKYNIKIEKFESAEEFLFKYEDDSSLDLLLLDIEMKGINGVELAKKLRDKEDRLQIIFISGYSEYITYGYDVDALHFLVKPISKEKLYNILDKALAKTNAEDKFILIKHGGALKKLYLNQIYYIKSDRNYILIDCKDEEFRVRMSIKEAMEKIDDRFHQIGRSEIINIEKIDSFDVEKIVLENTKVIYLPKGTFEELNRKIISYY